MSARDMCTCAWTRRDHNAACPACEDAHAAAARRDALRAGEWLPDVTYPAGHRTTWDGIRYRAIRSHTSQPGSPPPVAGGLWEVAA